MTVVTRFAPSPTGLLHIGNVRTALVAWLFARKSDGTFILRLDDTDRERSREEYVQAIEQDLEWLGLGWDQVVRQSDRLQRYAEAVERLKATGRLYACYETPEELERRRKLQLARHKPPVYDRAALKLSDTERQALEEEGREPHWRFLLDHETVGWTDLVRGPVEFDMSSLSDPVVIRSDGTPLYHLCSVVDDIELGVTHVVRGEDHVTNTAEHVQMFHALDGRPPVFAHLALLTGAGGEGLSKRLGSIGIASLREEGAEALAITSLLARLGTADPVEARTDMGEILAGFDIARFGRAPARFDAEELARLNARVLHALPFCDVADRLADLGIPSADERFWLAVRGNLDKLVDCLEWWQVVAEPVAPVIENSALTSRAADLLPEGELDGDSWGALTGALKTELGLKGKALFHPLRLALTARERGPEMKNLLPLIGSARAKARFRGETA